MPKTTKQETINFETGRFVAGVNAQEVLENTRKMLATTRGRPRQGEKADGSRAKSLRLPDVAWEDLAKVAKERKTTVHRLLRRIVAEYLYTQTWKEREESRMSVTEAERLNEIVERHSKAPDDKRARRKKKAA